MKSTRKIIYKKKKKLRKTMPEVLCVKEYSTTIVCNECVLNLPDDEIETRLKVATFFYFNIFL